MTREAVAKLLWDARQATDRMARITDGRRFEDYQSDEVLRWAVERQFIVVGEALSALRRIDQAVEPPSPIWPGSSRSAMSLVHGYPGVLVWGVVERDLTVLRTSLARLLEAGG